ncbi:hypothetical protein Nepgr_002407 [Nepenthes gracilis]|uniref:non-specific serine/threonine protein kinase n=1 Tax=Nepenthes gracilis TaxID=150966 RepID=A0AAD3P6W8_NEPGR|nr:hypothetical protein Nepgr_002407 [Nepenthes gracilis]
MQSRHPPPLAAPTLIHRHNCCIFLRRSHVISPVTASIVSLILMLIVVILYRKLTRSRTAPAPASDHQNLSATKQPLRRFSYTVLRRATSSFSSCNRLGQGGFGSVYRGVLPSGQPVAVKLMETAGSFQGEREFQNEISLATRINDEVSWKSPFIVSILGHSSDKRGQRKLLVYELMSNGSLQDKLLDQKCAELLDWEKRFRIVLDVAKALLYLHFMCGRTPIIHGDVKPSNVLLDGEFNAKLGDFGLAKILEDNDDDDVRVLVEAEGNERAECGGRSKVKSNGFEDAGSVMKDMECVPTGFEEAIEVSDRSPEGSPGTLDVNINPEELVVVETPRSEGFEKASFDKISVESGNGRVGKKKSGSRRDWWRKQDTFGGSESGSVKGYVTEWILNEIKRERPMNEWVGTSSSAADASIASLVAKIEPKKHKKRLNCWTSFNDEKRRKEDNGRKPREWWREEFCEELTEKKKSAKPNSGAKLWWQRDEGFVPERKKSRSRSGLRSIDWWLDGLNAELRSGRRTSQDCATGNIPKSGGISSTPSMRGTVCYIAPEYGGGEQLSEKCDVYSFGVLVLVILSGRRPLQLMASPVSEFERANLISWARQLAYNGKMLDLVDPTIQSLDREQALLCITIALLCLQRLPSKRPNMKEIVEMLSGTAEPPHLPLEFSPSPPSNFPFKSRNKVW